MTEDLERRAPPASGPDLGGREVFEILVRENARTLTAYLRSVVRADDVVDDLFQETMLTAWRRLDRYDRRRPFGPWLRGIATNLVRRHHARAPEDLLRCEPEVLAELERRFHAMTSAPTGVSGAVDRLRDCLGRLPERLGRVIDLVYRRGLLVRDAAAELGASEEAAKKRLQRGRTQLAECMERAGGAE